MYTPSFHGPRYLSAPVSACANTQRAALIIIMSPLIPLRIRPRVLRVCYKLPLPPSPSNSIIWHYVGAPPATATEPTAHNHRSLSSRQMCLFNI